MSIESLPEPILEWHAIGKGYLSSDGRFLVSQQGMSCWAAIHLVRPISKAVKDVNGCELFSTPEDAMEACRVA